MLLQVKSVLQVMTVYGNSKENIHMLRIQSVPNQNEVILLVGNVVTPKMDQ